MERLVQKQVDLQGRIGRAYENLKKLGSANMTKGAIQSRLDGLNENWTKFENYHEQLLAFYDKDTAKHDYFVNKFFDKTEELYYTQKTRFLDLLIQDVDLDNTRSLLPTTETLPSSKLRLSTIDVPRFSGSFQTWVQFKEMFTSLVRRDLSLSNIERMHYLLNALSGEPAQMLQGIPVTGENFERAWKELVNRYDNKRLLVNTQFSTLAAIKPMHTDSAPELKRILHSTVNVVNSLEALGRPIDNGADWLVHTTVERLASDTLQKWEASLGGSTEPPSFEQLRGFLETQVRTLEAVETKTRIHPPKQTHKPIVQSTAKNVRIHQITKRELPKARCSLCHGNHYIVFCEALTSKSVSERKQIILSRKLCLNCLGKHELADCVSEKRCQKCLEKHHTILHVTKPSQAALDQRTTNVAFWDKGETDPVVLATAEVFAVTHHGEDLQARALIDPCSEISLISENLAQLLQLPRQETNIVVSGVGLSERQRARGKVNLTIKSRLEPEFQFNVNAFILPKVTTYQPSRRPEQSHWPHLNELDLTDPNFDAKGRLDLILGVEVYVSILQEGLRKSKPDAPIAQRTSLGWIVSGKIDAPGGLTNTTVAQLTVQHSLDDDLLPLIQRFWEQEELTVPSTTLSPEEQQCEEHFHSTHCRTASGRYMVRLPTKGNLPNFGNSKALATKRQAALERRFLREPDFAKLYRAFMNDYETLGHMEEVKEGHNPTVVTEYFLPHHGVRKESSTTTKLRVVFNGSQITSSGRSLNDFLLPGPNLLPELADILLCWRVHKFVFSADIEKMYRQILVHPEDCTVQQIVWRPSPEQRLRTYRLKTVTYGLTCAPFLAIRTLRQLATDEEHLYPLGANTLRSTCYMDDILAGDATISAAKQRQTELINLCKAGGFTLRKWTANARELIPYDQEGRNENKYFSWPNEEGRSILGITWNPIMDSFTYQVTFHELPTVLTKRTILSRIARLFDPLGWLFPVTISAKIFMQSLWLLALDWDTPLPSTQESQWVKLYGKLPAISQISIPRWIQADIKDTVIEIHGFADASERAKAAAVYIRVLTDTSGATTSLVMGSQLLPHAAWHHIEGSDNPADCASRGMSPSQLQNFPLWWHGPERLSATRDPWQKSNPYEETEQEIRKVVATVTCQPACQVWELLHQYSNLTKLLRITAWCQRWISNCTKRKTEKAPYLTTDELRRALLFWVATVQKASYSDELEQLHRQNNVPRKSLLRRLNPILDKGGLLRVGGRLKHSLLSYDEKHPLILPPNSPFTELIIEHAHQKTLHGGVQLTLGTLRRAYWILRGRSLVKTCIHKCVQCTRWRSSSARQQMADLPATRVIPSRPFLHSGLDYAGPIQLRASKERRQKAYKGYIAIFVCFATKALHLEVVLDYTSEAFLAAFHRFVSRRGICSTLTSDCGSNFIGAAAELRRLFTAASKESEEIAAKLANDGTVWRFNPPAAPHFGGLWEAAVKSTKFHLRRVIGDAKLTYEEMTTFLTRVEACLNSRPLQPLTDDPEDLTALTPGHFLIGAPLCAVPEPSLIDVPMSRLNRWQLIRRMQEHFWKRWSQEYLQTLQPRGKWDKKETSLKVGDLCLVKSETSPPSKWPLARILETHPGNDNLIRVVTVKTASSTLKRSVTKIIPLNLPE